MGNTEERGIYRTRFAAFWLVLTVVWMLGQARLVSTHPYYDSHYQQYPQYNPEYSDFLVRFLSALDRKVGFLQHLIHKLASRQCQTGSVNLGDCPRFGEAPTNEILECVSSPSAGGGVNITDVTVTFMREFDETPVVSVALSGLALLGSKNCTSEVLSVTKSDVTFRFTADDFLPLSAQLTFYACPGAILKQRDPEYPYY